MTLNELIAIINSSSGPNRPSSCADSRQVKPGDIFIAIKGKQFDGHDFISNAVESGAGYVVCQRCGPVGSAEIIIVRDSAHALAQLAQAFYGNPSSKLTNLAVTGTNGKTTVTFLTQAVIKSAGGRCGLVGTVFNDTGSVQGVTKAELTTPDALAIARLSAEMVSAGVEYTVLEASSHSLDQNRLAEVDFKAAAFTNLTGDHLDYHGDMDKYLAAKTKLFAALKPTATAILNKQDSCSVKIAEATRAKILFYAVDAPADISAEVKSMDINGTVFAICYNGKSCDVHSRLIGKHNVSNHLAASGLCVGAGFDLKTIAEGLSSLDCVPGRLEPVDCGQGFAVFVDYAHTDDALKNVLSTIKPLCKGRLKILFGCGGDRDKTKRPRMAKVAESLADEVIVTSDNPRTENPEAIIDDIVKGFSADKENLFVEPDRKKAIGLALKNAGTNDVILIAGKGHEDYQILGTQKIHFSDSEVIGEYLQS